MAAATDARALHGDGGVGFEADEGDSPTDDLVVARAQDASWSQLDLDALWILAERWDSGELASDGQNERLRLLVKPFYGHEARFEVWGGDQGPQMGDPEADMLSLNIECLLGKR